MDHAAETDLMGIPDAELGVHFAAGDDLILAECYRRWSPLIYSIAVASLRDKHDADDVTQLVFTSAWRSRTKYKPDTAPLRAWLIGITRHRIADAVRQRSRDLRLVGAVQAETSDIDQDESVDSATDKMLLAATLDDLDEPRRTILRRLFYEDLTQAQVANQMDLPLGTVKSHARRGLLQLRSMLKGGAE